MTASARPRLAAHALVLLGLTGCMSELDPPEAEPAVVDPTTQALVTEVMEAIRPDEVERRVKELEAMSSPNRETRSDNYLRATEWVRALVESPATPVRFHEPPGYRNVEITIAGSEPSRVYVLGGHFDSVARSPGIDDNASGSLGAALIAKALGPYRFRGEIRVVLFDAEEQGFEGSLLYAQELLDQGCRPRTCMRHFVNLDMIGYDPGNRGVVKVLTAVPALAAHVGRVNQAFGLGLELRTGGSGCNSSDDCAFDHHGFAAAGIYEGTPFTGLHTPRDTSANINFTTLTRTLRLVAASLATWAEIQGRR